MFIANYDYILSIGLAAFTGENDADGVAHTSVGAGPVTPLDTAIK
jgi:hypothetical protein